MLVPSVSMRCAICAVIALFAVHVHALGTPPEPERLTGDRIPIAQLGVGVVEPMDVVRLRQDTLDFDNGSGRVAGQTPGVWEIPGRNASTATHSGRHYAANRGGDPYMAIGFPDLARVHSVYVHGQGGKTSWAAAIRFIGERDGDVVGTTPWFGNISASPRRVEINFHHIDRLRIEARPSAGELAWYGLDDLSFTPIDDGEPAAPARVLLDFEDCDWEQRLTGSSFAGLTWETGEGRFLDGEDPDIVPAPKVPPGAELEVDPADVGGGGSGPVLGEGTEANILNAFETTQRGDAGSFSTPPDHELAVGPQHVVVVVNRAIEMFDKSTGALEFSSSLGAFMPGSNGDPRIVFDQYSGRFIVLATDFSSRIFLAVSTSDDPLDPWYKTDFVIAQGTDEGTWPDHPTLGVDANGIYTASYMVGGTAGMTLVVIDKAPLISDTPSLGTVTAFRNLAFDGAIQPVHSYGETTGEYVISRFGAGGLRVRRIDGPLTSPTLLNLGVIDVPSFSSPPDISALGTSTPLDSVDTRLFSAMYRDGLIWTAHCTGNGTNRSIARWYAVDPVLMALVQTGVVSDPVNSFLFPTIAVDVFGNAVLGATICGPNLSPSACFVSRAFSDPAGVMSDPVIFRDGSGSNFDIIDQFGRNRWGDYSMTVADPDGFSVWTVQEYVHGTNVWGTHVAQAQVLAPPANNFCSAGQLLEPEPTAFTTQFATTDPFAATTCGEVSSDVWYRFPVTREGDLHISFGDVTFDAVVAIYDTFCPDDENDTPIACVTVENGSVDLVVPVQPNLYRIRIGSPTGAQGTGVLDAFVDAPLPCRGDCAPKNIDGSFGNGTVDVDDILAVINVMFTTSDGACDLSPDNGDGTFGNGIINVDDLFAVLQAVGDC